MAEVRDFAKIYRLGCCKMPQGFSHKASLAASAGFMAPSRVDMRDFCTPTEDQGATPWCAAYAAVQWAENILWRVEDAPREIAAKWVYEWAKQHDGHPNEDGTSLTDVLEALRGSVFDRDKCKVKVVRANRLSVRYALHKFGCVLGSFNLDSSWWTATKQSPIIDGEGEQNLGYHAVLLCGYDKQGVWLQNSWGKDWGEYGFAKIVWPAFDKQFSYGAVLSNALDDLTINT